MIEPLSLATPEKPTGAYDPARWPISWVPLGILMAGALTVIGGVTALLIASLFGIDVQAKQESWLVVIGTMIQGAAMLFTVWWFIKRRFRPRPWHLGLRPTPFSHALSWAISGMLAFYAFTIIWGLLAGGGEEQEILQKLGAGKGAIELIAAGLVVIAIAPVLEEIFFRGFLYAGLRSRCGPLMSALLGGLIFGLVHYTGSGSLVSLPVLGVLGIIFCVVYEKTGSLYTVIALHAFNNAVAFSIGTGGDVQVGIIIGACMIVGCILAARLSGQPPARIAPADPPIRSELNLDRPEAIKP